VGIEDDAGEGDEGESDEDEGKSEDDADEDEEGYVAGRDEKRRGVSLQHRE
jgi:hypothetical protein